MEKAQTGAERHAYRDDMEDSYGAGYTTRSSDEGYGERCGERYSEAVKAVLDKKAQKEDHVGEMQSGMTANRDLSADAGVHPEYNRSQGSHVAQKEDSRHATNDQFEDASTGKSRAV
ncbi:uncharacterized protein [Physcomitrium patens]|uniref:Uncharacterized protein n=1 Tax=Physcomitrium patens TaxID=3218 RepID=A0A2K1K466_PHYPA|nr:hypothetical protein PHYPA_013037 [Physcomitrium patens]